MPYWGLVMDRTMHKGDFRLHVLLSLCGSWLQKEPVHLFLVPRSPNEFPTRKSRYVLKMISVIDDWIRKGEKLGPGRAQSLQTGGMGEDEGATEAPSKNRVLRSLDRCQGDTRHDSGPHPEALVFQDGRLRIREVCESLGKGELSQESSWLVEADFRVSWCSFWFL